jgi:hypothetical protein
VDWGWTVTCAEQILDRLAVAPDGLNTHEIRQYLTSLIPSFTHSEIEGTLFRLAMDKRIYNDVTQLTRWRVKGQE